VKFQKYVSVLSAAAAVLTVGALSLFPSPAAQAESYNGFQTGVHTVLRGDTDTFYVRFYGGEVAGVAAVGDGDIDIKVYDSRGRLVDMDVLADYEPVCTWVPRYTQNYTIQVINHARYAVDYVIGTN